MVNLVLEVQSWDILLPHSPTLPESKFYRSSFDDHGFGVKFASTGFIQQSGWNPRWVRSDLMLYRIHWDRSHGPFNRRGHASPWDLLFSSSISNHIRFIGLPCTPCLRFSIASSRCWSLPAEHTRLVQRRYLRPAWTFALFLLSNASVFQMDSESRLQVYDFKQNL